MVDCKTSFNNEAPITRTDRAVAGFNASMTAITGACSSGFVANMLLTAVGVASNPVVVCLVLTAFLLGGHEGWRSGYKREMDALSRQGRPRSAPTV